MQAVTDPLNTLETDAVKTAVRPHKLDEVMLAMDVVDTLRHEQKMLERDLSAPDREQALIKRLREIYTAQGIEVPDEILRNGVKAMDDHRYAYSSQKDSFLARAYINRARWGKPLLLVLGIIGAAWTINFAAFEMPKRAESAKIERLLDKTLPKQLRSSRDQGLKLAKTDAIKQQIGSLYDGGIAAIAGRDIDAAKQADADLLSLTARLGQSYRLRIISRPGELSGVIRGADDNASISNYYLIVEGIGANGRAAMVELQSEENQKRTRINKWGVRVPKSVFDRVGADKKDDGIIQNAVIGQKKTGHLEPQYSVKTLGGVIVKW